MSPANRDLNLFHHIRTVSWQMPILRSKSKFSTDAMTAEKPMYIVTTGRITSGADLK